MTVIRVKKKPWRYGVSYFLTTGTHRHVIHTTLLEYRDQRSSIARRLLRARNNLRLNAQQEKGGAE